MALHNAFGNIATEAKQDTAIDRLTSILAAVDGLEGFADGVEGGLAGVISALGPKATENTLAAVLVALGPLATESTLGDVLAALGPLGTETTLAAILAAVDGLETSTDGIEGGLANVVTALGPQATEDTLADVLAALGPLGTEATLAAVVAALGPLATEATLDNLRDELLTRVPAALDADGGLKVHVQNPDEAGLTNAELRAAPVVVREDKGVFVDSGAVLIPNLGGGASATHNTPVVPAGRTGKLHEVSVSSTISVRVNISSVLGGVVTGLRTFVLAARDPFRFVPGSPSLLTAAAGANFRVTVTSLEGGVTPATGDVHISIGYEHT